jgi:3-phenylpropionate/trans-cinnamate dioxygenase alpha subunit
VVRDNTSQVHAFLNVCRHRGNRLCRADTGNAATFTCAYHGWTYRNDGRLVGVPYLKEAYHGELDRERWGLTPAAQLDNYKGLYFATFDPEATPLREYLGEMAWYIDTFVDRREGCIEIVATHKWVTPCNWKFPAENFGGDAYHVHWSHGAAIATGFSVGSTASPATANRMVSPGNGHVLICIGPDGFDDAPMPEIQAYEREIRPEVKERLGSRAALVNPIVGTVFPNFSLLRGTSRTLRVRHPRGPQKTEIWSWVFVDKAAPPEVKNAFRLSGLVASARPEPLSRTTSTIGRNARRPAAASWRGACRSTIRWASGTSASMPPSAPGPAIPASARATIGSSTAAGRS